MTHQDALDHIDKLRAHIAADNPATGGGGQLIGVLKIVWPFLKGLLDSILGAKP